MADTVESFVEVAEEHLKLEYNTAIVEMAPYCYNLVAVDTAVDFVDVADAVVDEVVADAADEVGDKPFH